MELNPKDVNQNSSPEQEVQLPEETVVTSQVVETPAKGSQTPPENLYAALAEERRLRKELEDKITNLTTTQTEEVYSDEGKALKQELDAIKDKLELREIQDKFPQLKGLEAEFNEFRREYPRHKGENVAKLFLTEKGILEPVRKGLEKPTGGERTQVNPEMTMDDVRKLRETDFRKYTDMVKKGLIKV